MKSDTKKYYKIPQKMLEIFLARGYQELRVVIRACLIRIMTV